MLAMTLVVCAGVGLSGGVRARRAATARPANSSVSRRPRRGFAAVAAVVGVVIALAAGAAGRARRSLGGVQGAAAGSSAGAERFESASGNGRYQYWQSALDANATDAADRDRPGHLRVLVGARGDARRASSATPTRSTSRRSASSGSSASC